VLYLGSILWVIGYDTIYALQDIEDDALIGVKSTARLFGSRAREIVALFYAGAIVLWAIAIWLVNGGPVPLLGLAAFAAIMAWQLLTLDARVPGNPGRRFVSNGWAGLVLTATMAVGWWLSRGA
jgi:4-hydroxybenzoate polyprenyltransferase